MRFYRFLNIDTTLMFLVINSFMIQYVLFTKSYNSSVKALS